MTFEAKRSELYSGRQVSPAVLTAALNTLYERPDVRDRASGNARSGPGAGQRAWNRFQTRMGERGSDLLDALAPALNTLAGDGSISVKDVMQSAGAVGNPPGLILSSLSQFGQALSPLTAELQALDAMLVGLNARGSGGGPGGGGGGGGGSGGFLGGSSGNAEADALGLYGRKAEAYADARAAGLSVAGAQMFVRQIDQESGFRTDQVSPAGARGIAQFMPGTAKQAAALIGVSEEQFWADPSLQLRGAAALDAQYRQQYGSDRNALIAYNAGPGRVGSANLPPETEQYVQTILGGANVQNAEDSPLTTALPGGAGGGDTHVHIDVGGMTVHNSGPLADPATVEQHANLLAAALAQKHADILNVANNRRVAP